MRKIIGSLMAAALVITLASCGGSKMAQKYEQNINGTWQLETVVSEGISGNYKANIFNEEDFNCFVGSTWQFKKANNLGSYSISKNAGNCVAVQRNFRWSTSSQDGAADHFQFKRLTDNLKPMDDGAGFVFKILQSTSTVLQLKSEFSYEGKPAAFMYNFVRIK